MLASSDPRFSEADYLGYAVLTMCRALHTLHHGVVVSKPVAARWASGAVDKKWVTLIEAASAWREDELLKHTTDVADFVRWVVERSEPSYNI